MPKKNDFIIVGGGLVGCLASLILSKKNYTICLVEKKTFKHIISDDFHIWKERIIKRLIKRL